VIDATYREIDGMVYELYVLPEKEMVGKGKGLLFVNLNL